MCVIVVDIVTGIHWLCVCWCVFAGVCLLVCVDVMMVMSYVYKLSFSRDGCYGMSDLCMLKSVGKMTWWCVVYSLCPFI